MFLTEANLLYYLLERRFADLDSVVDGAYRVRNLSRRNRNFRVTCGEREYLVKQPKKWDAASRRTLEQEAAVYWRAKTDSAFEPLKALVPESYAYDPSQSVLILEYLAGRSNLRHSGRRFVPEVARLAGATMGAFHRQMRSESMAAQFPARFPWYIAVHQSNWADLDDATEGQRELLRTIPRYAEFGNALESLRAECRGETVVHGDWKLENCLLAGDGSGLHVIDWELSHWGDPFEDAGTALQSYVVDWVRRPFEIAIGTVRTAVRAFVEGYAAEAQCDAAAIAPRALRFGAARMLQTAYEVLDHSDEMTADAVRLLQASLNILTRPEWAQSEIFGAWN